MNTPIADFVKEYCKKNTARLHMPGHKGVGPLGFEALDLTEITGADDLADADGIIAQSEDNATALFGSLHTFYTTGGCSQAIKAMVYLALLGDTSGSRTIVAGRNAHKAFLHACALLGVTPVWLLPAQEESLCSCPVTPAQLEAVLSSLPALPAAVYLTSPDYLGGCLDIRALADVCRKYKVPLLVDNAHGAYLHFLSPAAHPLDLGADMCCDSAHKTLPVLTGGAYLHVKDNKIYARMARQALAVFGSSSPSYLILQSLDLCNRTLADAFPEQLQRCIRRVDALKKKLADIPICPGEPLKLVIDAAAMGCSGYDIKELLQAENVEPEFADLDHVVLMFAPNLPEDADERIFRALKNAPRGPARKPLALAAPGISRFSPREAFLSPRTLVPLEYAAGRICAETAVSCPPAIPLAILGEELTDEVIERMRQYGITAVSVVDC